MIDVQIANEHASLVPDETRLRAAIGSILGEAGIGRGSVSVAIVDDKTIARLNAQFLEHEGPTDVLSFVLEHEGDRLEGEIVVSADTATRVAAQVGWRADDELLLYVIHGALHLAGLDDLQEAERQQMRAAERQYLAAFGLEPHWPQ